MLVKEIALGLRPWPRRAAPWQRVVAHDPEDECFELFARRRGWRVAPIIGREDYLPAGWVADMYHGELAERAR